MKNKKLENHQFLLHATRADIEVGDADYDDGSALDNCSLTSLSDYVEGASTSKPRIKTNQSSFI